MALVNQICRCIVPGQVFGMWKLRCHLRIYRPNATKQVVVISDATLESGWFIPYKIEYLANHIIQKFQLNPERIIWVEHYSQLGQKLGYVTLTEIIFDWVAGQATNPQRKVLSQELTDLVLAKDCTDLTTGVGFRSLAI